MSVQGNPFTIHDNSLILSLDAANIKSYVGSGTSWIDLSGKGNNGTLTNSPTFSSNSFLFNGTNQYVDSGNASSLQITVGTIFAWTKATSPGSSYRSIIAKQNAWGLFFIDGVLGSYDWGNGSTRTTGLNIADGNWKHVAMSFTETSGTPSNNAIIYLNGNPVLTCTIKHSNNNINLQIAEANASQYLAGNIAYAAVYNRALSASEILQNYNAVKSRFGL